MKVSTNKANIARRESKERRLLHGAQKRSNLKKMEINITLADIVIPHTCIYLGIPLNSTNASLDRIDSTKGYVKGNIQVISALANRMKNDATLEELVTFAKGVLAVHGS